MCRTSEFSPIRQGIRTSSDPIRDNRLRYHFEGSFNTAALQYNWIMPQRDHYIDHLRSVATVQVIFAHASMTYGGTGNWFYREIASSRSISSVLFTLLVVLSQAYLMGLFFLLAGYFTPHSFDRKGQIQFLADRLLRLGIPLLLFGLVLAPLSVGMVAGTFGPGFWPAIITLWRDCNFINGPLWFAEGLLVFSIGFAIWRALPRSENGSQSVARPLPGNWAWLIGASLIFLTTFAMRIFIRADIRVAGLWVSTFPGYIFFFCAGVAAWHGKWLQQLTWHQARLWLLISCLVFPTLPIGKSFLHGAQNSMQLLGGLSWPAALYAFWDPFLAFGIIASLLILFRRYLNHASALWTWLDRRAYAVFVLHTPVLVAVCLLLRNWHAPAMVKFVGSGSIACLATWLIADPLVRLPGLRRIL
jgi:hypothetical protein